MLPNKRIVFKITISQCHKFAIFTILFHNSDEGSIYLDGVNLKKLDSKWFRNEMIGYIGQEPVLFSGSILDNIRYGNPNATFDDVIDAAKRANAHDFILSFPDGYDSLVGERGAALSGGQKQRIAIARAIIKNPQILILDEATSALGNIFQQLQIHLKNSSDNGIFH